MSPRKHAESFSLYAPTGARKYLNQQERGARWPPCGRCRRIAHSSPFALLGPAAA